MIYLKKYTRIHKSHMLNKLILWFSKKKKTFSSCFALFLLILAKPIIYICFVYVLPSNTPRSNPATHGFQTQMRFPWFIGCFSHLLGMFIMKKAYQLLDLKGSFSSVFNYSQVASLIFFNAVTWGGTLKSFIDSKLVFCCHLLVNGIYHLNTKSLVSCFHTKTN